MSFQCKNSERMDIITTDSCNTMASHICDICGSGFDTKYRLSKHLQRIHTSKRFTCNRPTCDKSFKRKDKLHRHERTHLKRKANPFSAVPAKRACDQTLTASVLPSTSKGNQYATRRSDVCGNYISNPGSSASQHTQNYPCIWCKKQTELLPGKLFCSNCSKDGVECCSCRRPLPQRFYTMHKSQCNACHRKKQNQLGRGPSRAAALEGRVQTHTLRSTANNEGDLLLLFNDNEDHIIDLLNTQLHEHLGLKWYLVVHIRLVRYTSEGEEIATEPSFRSLNNIVTNNSQFQPALADTFHKIYQSFQTYQSEGSGWTLDKVLQLDIHVGKYNPIRGSTYIPTPKALTGKHAIVNVKNSDDYCFVWSILAGLFPTDKNTERLSNYTKYFNTLNLEDLTFPLTLDQIPLFESQNNLSLNVMGYERGVFPLYVTNKRCNTHLTLLLISQDDVRHYCLVKSLSRLLGDRTKHCRTTHYCDYCLHGFIRKDLLDEHLPHCTILGPQRTIMPKDPLLQFKNIRNQLRIPFVIYADFECFTTKIDESSGKSTRYEQHDPSSFCYKVVCSISKYSKPPVVYRGPKVVETFLRALQNENDYICGILNEIRPMIISPDQELGFQRATHCHICDKKLGEDSVRDHCHITGLYRGPAHNACNLQFRFRCTNKEEARKFFIPVVLHNCRNYDGHLICGVLGMFRHLNIKCIANNIQRYVSFSLGNIRFVDSAQFLNASLETLVSNMAKECSGKFLQLKAHFPEPEQQTLLLRKGVFPYAYVRDESVFSETQLPPIEAFYNDLKEEPLSVEDFAHAQSVWAKFNIDTIGSYQDLYVKCDVLLLSDIFENFRDICLNYYKLDPLHYYTSPGLSWDAMLKMTGVQLELLQDIDQHLMVEAGIRGGISVITQKYAKANNPYVEGYNPSQPSNYIMYLDANNLYGWAMSQYLPLKNFTWLNERQIRDFDVESVADDADTGYILEVDIEYPSHLHHGHNCYPLCSERMKITDDLLSDYSKSLKQELDLRGKPVEKLVPNLYNKSKYVIHYRELKFCLAQGMKLTKIHRGIQFSQAPWLKPYIDFNTEKRKHASNDFEKDFFKLLNNAIFGKTMENLRKRSRIELVHDNAKLEKLIAKPSFQSFTIFNKDLCGVHLKKTKLTLNRPVYVGFTILDLSKLLMYDFHYNYIRCKYGDEAKLLFTDTDSLCYDIHCDDIYRDMKGDLHLFDTSNYPKDHPLFSSTNAKTLGKFKDETAGEPISEFVGPRPKMYSLAYGGREKKTAKGIAKYAVKKKLRHDMYKTALLEKRLFNTSMNCIRSFDHNIFSIHQNKIALSPFDDKRHVLDNGIDTLAHGHYKAKVFPDTCEVSEECEV